MRRVHFFIGILGVLVFLASGQVLRFHHPALKTLDGGVHMMYVSRHIYILGTALINLVLGMYLRIHNRDWRRILQVIGSALLLASPALLTLAFFTEPALGLAGRSWRAALGLQAMFAGAMLHLLASFGAGRIDTPESRL